MNPIIIVGTGLGGYTLAREWRRLDADAPLLILTRDEGSFYSKPMLSNALASGRSAAALVNATAEKMAVQLRAEIRTGASLTGIDPAQRSVRVDGAPIAYGRLVLALGADPIGLDLEGDAAQTVLSVNDLADYARFRAAAEGRRRIAILGAGLIGCEFANDLCAAGYAVDVVDPAPHPLGRLVPPQVGHTMAAGLERAGVRWHLGQVAEQVTHAGQGYRLRLSDGEILETDLVLSAVGLRPRTELARAAGLQVGRAIAVDRHLQSSASEVYALGDCAEVDGLVLPYVMPIMNAARALAKTLAGEPVPVHYPPMPVVVKTPAWPTVVSPPAPGAQGEWTIQAEQGGIQALFRDEKGALLGFALAGEHVSRKNALTRDLPDVLS